MNILNQALKNIVRNNICNGTKISTILLFLLKLSKNVWRNYKIVPIQWMDYEKISNKDLLRIKQNSISIGPKFVDSRENTIFELVLPEIFYRVFGDAQIAATSSSVCIEGDILIERIRKQEQKKYDYSSGQIKMHGESFALVKYKNPENIERGIFLGGNGACNYYHWLIEIIPKFEFLNELPDNFNDFPLLIPDCARDISSFSEILNIVAKGRQIIYLNQLDIYLVHELIYIDTPNNLPFNIVGQNRFNSTDFYFRKESLEFIRHTFIDELVKNKESENYPKKIFLARDSEIGKRKYNQNEVKEKLEELGFVSVFMDKLSFCEQVKVINRADWIVGPTGAAWANIVFAKKGAKCLCWMAEQYGDFSAFSNIAEFIGVVLEYLKIDIPVRETRFLYKQDYIVETAAIERALFNIGF